MLDRLRERIHYMHYSIRTEEVYVYWVRFYILFHGLRHPATLGANVVGQYARPGGIDIQAEKK